jgi:hypothetical protein
MHTPRTARYASGFAFLETIVRSGPQRGLPVGLPIPIALTPDAAIYAELTQAVAEAAPEGEASRRQVAWDCVAVGTALAEKSSSHELAREAVLRAGRIRAYRALGLLMQAYAHVPNLDGRVAYHSSPRYVAAKTAVDVASMATCKQSDTWE